MLVKNACFIVIKHENSSTWKDEYKRVKVVGICARKPIQLDNCTASWRLGQDFQIRLGPVVGSDLAPDNEDRSISEDRSSFGDCQWTIF
jgi:hypothetical protein